VTAHLRMDGLQILAKRILWRVSKPRSIAAAWMAKKKRKRKKRKKKRRRKKKRKRKKRKRKKRKRNQKKKRKKKKRKRKKRKKKKVKISRKTRLTLNQKKVKISRKTRGERQSLRSSLKTTNNQTRRPTNNHRTHRQRTIQRQVPMIKHQEQTTRPQAAETLVTHPPHRHSSHLAQTHSQAEAKTPPHHPLKPPVQAVAGKTLPHRAPVNRGIVHRMPVSLP
ncbi:MAG: hypothetical protein V1924_06835, partial [Candidatus Bathyarchaeota archaeon]